MKSAPRHSRQPRSKLSSYDLTSPGVRESALLSSDSKDRTRSSFTVCLTRFFFSAHRAITKHTRAGRHLQFPFD